MTNIVEFTKLKTLKNLLSVFLADPSSTEESDQGKDQPEQCPNCNGYWRRQRHPGYIMKVWG